MVNAPFPYFGGKGFIAADIWDRFGKVDNYVEPFFGSGAVLLRRPDWEPGATETVNDADGLLANAWRGIQYDPAAVAKHADWPVSECDLHARHAWLVGRRDDITERIMGDPDWFDAQAAGWWIWGACAWIAGGWCSGEGPWQAVEGRLVKGEGLGIKRKLPHLFWGRGINRQLPHLGDRGRGINRKRPHLGNRGQGINRQRPHLGDRGEWIYQWFSELSRRLRDVRVCCGDWSRVCGPTPTVKQGLTAVFLDPPYSEEANRDMGCYATDSGTVAGEVRQWAIEHGNDKRLRIALCGYDTEHAMPADWTMHRWKANGGYGSQGNGQGRINAGRETVWFSPHCFKKMQPGLFDDNVCA